jgi:hypothetical protein
MKKINPNSVALAGEFAVLSQLALRGYDANMTLGHTKSVDILVSKPKTNEMFQLEVKTNLKNARTKPSRSAVFGLVESEWMMQEKHEHIESPTLFYCFVNISKNTDIFKFYIVPSSVVAKYIREEFQLWVSEKKKEGKKVKMTKMRTFRIGVKGQNPISTPTAEQYENNWNFKS